ncbi:MAG: hypothetical protein ACRDOH_29315 [Streptosporangiaceae bacterium]
MQPGTSLEEYVASGPVSGIVVVLDGRIVGILERRGLLDLGQPVDTVLFELAGSSWAGVNSFVLSWLAERVTGLPFAEVLDREIWSQARSEAADTCWHPARSRPPTRG